MYIGFLVTYKCPAECKHCLYQSSPRRNVLIRLEDVRRDLISLKSNWPIEAVCSDLNPLSELTDLQILSLVDNQIADLTPLSKLTNLWSLWVVNGVNGGNQISDLTPLSNLIRLRTMYIQTP